MQHCRLGMRSYSEKGKTVSNYVLGHNFQMFFLQTNYLITSHFCFCSSQSHRPPRKQQNNTSSKIYFFSCVRDFSQFTRSIKPFESRDLNIDEKRSEPLKIFFIWNPPFFLKNTKLLLILYVNEWEIINEFACRCTGMCWFKKYRSITFLSLSCTSLTSNII